MDDELHFLYVSHQVPFSVTGFLFLFDQIDNSNRKTKLYLYIYIFVMIMIICRYVRDFQSQTSVCMSAQTLRFKEWKEFILIKGIIVSINPNTKNLQLYKNESMHYFCMKDHVLY